MKAVQEFLKEIGFIQTWEEMKPVEEAFIDHMKKGMNGEKSSLPMLPAYLTVDSLPEESKDVIVMDAGGTNLRVALLRINPGQKPELLWHHKQPVPGKPGPMTPDAFFEALAQAVAPVADKSDRIGFCFSFPCRIRSDFDGEIIYLDKELDVPGIEGALVGEQLKKALGKLGVKNDHKVVILNDTVAALLGALAEHRASCYNGYIGMILGTGFNCCYSETNANIGKDEALCGKSGSSIINMEAGAFNGFKLSDADLLVREWAAVPDQNLWEKTMSGEYQGKLMDALLICAAKAGCFSTELAERILTKPLSFSAVDISIYLDAPARAGRLHDFAPDGEDAKVVYQLVDALLERASMCAVMNLTAIMHATQTGLDPIKPVCIAIEGTTFMKNTNFNRKIHGHLIHYTQRVRGHYCRVVSTDEANLVGSAVAAMTL